MVDTICTRNLVFSPGLSRGSSRKPYNFSATEVYVLTRVGCCVRDMFPKAYDFRGTEVNVTRRVACITRELLRCQVQCTREMHLCVFPSTWAYIKKGSAFLCAAPYAQDLHWIDHFLQLDVWALLKFELAVQLKPDDDRLLKMYTCTTLLFNHCGIKVVKSEHHIAWMR